VKNAAEILIIGGGIAGATLSRLLAEDGFEVLLVERLPEERIGGKVCGNAVPRKYFDWSGIPRPGAGEFDSRVEGLKIHSPDLETVFTLRDEGYVLNRSSFGQRLISESLDAGALLMDQTLGLSPIVKKNEVIGSRVKSLNLGQSRRFYGGMIVDATGIASRLRRMLPVDWWVSEYVRREESYACYREIRLLRKEMEDPEFCHVFLSNKIAPLGYYWIFPQGPSRVNVGVGIYTGLKRNPRRIFESHIEELPFLEGSEILDRGAGLVPNRRPLGSMVWNRFACIGDAGYQVNPLAGEGIGPSIYSASLLSEVLSETASEDYDLEALWPFNYRYMEALGARFSALNAFFQLMGNFSDEEINYTMASGLISERDLHSVRGRSGVELVGRVRLWFLLRALLERFSLLRRLRSLGSYVKEVYRLYSSYPSKPVEFESWRLSDLALTSDLKNSSILLDQSDLLS